MSSDKKHLHRWNPAQPSHRPSTLSELAILQKHHQFIRDEDDDDNSRTDQRNRSWEDKLALSWYSKLFREYALCDLTHYKAGGVALRWRTESEVLDRIGEASEEQQALKDNVSDVVCPTADLWQLALQVSSASRAA